MNKKVLEEIDKNWANDSSSYAYPSPNLNSYEALLDTSSTEGIGQNYTIEERRAKFGESLSVEELDLNYTNKTFEYEKFYKVKRNGETSEILSEEIVAGDLVFLKPKTYITFDGILVDQNPTAEIDESDMTGEPTLRKTRDKTSSYIYSGTLVVYGECWVLAVKVGKNSTIHVLLQSLRKEEKKTSCTIC